MKPFSRILVGLDLTQMDFILIKFICQFMRINPYIEKIYFIHVEKHLDRTGIKEEGLMEGVTPSDELFKIRMREEVEKYYTGTKGVELHFKIVEGDPIKQLNHWAEIKFIDLIVAGKKMKTRGSGLVMEKLARKTNCSILFVPENYPRRFKKILIPVDFSKRTDNVFEVAGMISKYLPNTRFICQHVVDVPHGYTKLGKSYEEFSNIMIGLAKNRWAQYEKSRHIECLNAEPVFVLNGHGSIAKSIIDHAHANHVDMIMMGSKKQTFASVFLLGSVGEELISRDKDILLLLVKHQRKRYGFLKAMKKV